MFDVQAWYVRDIILGLIKVPDRQDRATDVEDRLVLEDSSVKTAIDEVRYQGAYLKELNNETDYPQINVEKINELFYQWIEQRTGGIMTFRNNSYKSTIAGTVSPIHRTTSKDEFDDSMESYLKN